MKNRLKFKPNDADELRRDAEEYAKKAGIKVNPDEKIVDGIIMGLLKNKEKHGEAYCPCRVVTRNKEKDDDIICPCVFHKKEIETDGHCKCRLFVGKIEEVKFIRDLK